MAENYLIMSFAISIMINLFIIGFFLFSGIGQDAWKRFFRKKRHRKGGWAYSLMATKDGNIKEVFAKVLDHGGFEYNGKPYVRDPREINVFRGIPANFHREGSPNPFNPWTQESNPKEISCNELDIVMTAQTGFDFVQWFDKNKMYIFIGVAVIAIGLAVLGYLTYQNGELLKQLAKPVAQAATIPATGGA